MIGRVAHCTHWMAWPLALLLTGCGTTRMSDTARTAQEQLILSHAIDDAVNEIDFRLLAGRTVFLEEKYVDTKTDKGYLISSLRQHILAAGCLLQEKREDAEFILEARSGGVGTDRHSLLVGVPEMSLPTILPGQPSRIPEIPLAKKSDQQGVAKVAVFAYHRETGKRVWQSGIVKAQSNAKDLWVFGAGPFQNGNIRNRTTFAGHDLVVPFMTTEEGGAKVEHGPSVDVTQTAAWSAPGSARETHQTTALTEEELKTLLPMPPVPDPPQE